MTMSRASLVLATSFFLFLAWPPASSSAGTSSAGCTAFKSIGIDTVFAGDAFGGNRGSAILETFVAPETLISSITVWRYPLEHFFENPLKLWILNVDSTGTPLEHSVVLDGPLWSGTSPDSIHPTEVTYTFDPPVVLPGRKMYSIAIQDYQCILYFDLLTTGGSDPVDRYPEGHAWGSSISNFQNCILHGAMYDFSPLDLVFTIHFCDLAVPARKMTWGELKTHYR